MKNKLGGLCMVLGTVLMLAALSLLLFNTWQQKTAAKQADSIVAQLQPQIVQRQQAIENDQLPLPDPYDSTMTRVEIDGHDYIGYIMLPQLDLQLPVMADHSAAQLKISPCRYTGSTKTDDLVIMAHNYKKHFGSLGTLAPDAPVYFTDMDGVTTQYRVVAIDILADTAVAEMTAGEYDLTLFTCTYGGESRVTVRCERVQ